MNEAITFKKAREALGLQQKHIAEYFNLTPPSVSRIESGARKTMASALFAYIVNGLLEESPDGDPSKEVLPLDIVRALDSIPSDRRSEGAAFIAVHRLAYKRGRFEVLDDSIGENSVYKEESPNEEDARVLGLTQKLQDYKRLVRNFSKKQGARARGYLERSEDLMAQAILNLERAEDAIDEDRQSLESREDEDPPKTTD